MKERSKHLIAALCLIAAVVAFRLLPIYGSEGLKSALANFAPLAGLALCGGLLLPRKLAAGITFGAFLISDIALNLHYEQPLVNPYSLVLLVAFAAIFFSGWALRKRANLATALIGTAAGALAFYVIANTASFLYDPGYTKTFAGWIQAQSVGLPSFPPSWVFGLRMLAGNLVFALAFVLAVRPSTRPASDLATAPAA